MRPPLPDHIRDVEAETARAGHARRITSRSCLAGSGLDDEEPTRWLLAVPRRPRAESFTVAGHGQVVVNPHIAVLEPGLMDIDMTTVRLVGSKLDAEQPTSAVQAYCETGSDELDDNLLRLLFDSDRVGLVRDVPASKSSLPGMKSPPGGSPEECRREGRMGGQGIARRMRALESRSPANDPHGAASPPEKVLSRPSCSALRHLR